MTPPLPFQDLINFLFDTVKHPDGRPYTTQEVADHVSISHATINQLRTGRIKGPTLPTLQELARFFAVPLNFFDCTSFDECYTILAQGRPQTTMVAAEIAFRAAELSPKSQQDLLRILAWVEMAERTRKSGHDVPDFPLPDET